MAIDLSVLNHGQVTRDDSKAGIPLHQQEDLKLLGGLCISPLHGGVCGNRIRTHDMYQPLIRDHNHLADCGHKNKCGRETFYKFPSVLHERWLKWVQRQHIFFEII
ncbi:hypothetical protein TNCV_944111 [Trichonephila clavipes]|nr:hypothetical protein TNCV_944111 [Trichonephila clavipes]